MLPSQNTLIPEILFEDTHLVVLNKPAGLLSQSDQTGEPSLVDWLRTHFGRHYVGLIHRLDRNTSGIMVVGKRTKSSRRLTESLQKGKLRRTYLAWVLGNVEGPLELKHFLEKNEKTNEVRVVQTGGKLALLNACPLRKGTWQGMPLTLLEVELETGRSHQIRVQFAHIGHPLLGDPKYGKPETQGFGRPALHSWKLSFPHPMSGEEQSFEAKEPQDWKNL